MSELVTEMDKEKTTLEERLRQLEDQIEQSGEAYKKLNENLVERTNKVTQIASLMEAL